MDRGTHDWFSMYSAKYSYVAVLVASLCLSLLGRAMADGFQLPIKNAGTWGDSPAALISDIDAAFKKSGFKEALTSVGEIAKDVSQGKVPVIDDLAGTIEGNARELVADSLSQATALTRVVGKLDAGQLRKLYNDLQAKMATQQEFAFSIPDGRLVVRHDGTDLSVVAVIAAPGGVRVTLGLSNGRQLGGNPSERFVNPTAEPVLFADVAIGYSNLQVRRKLFGPVVAGIDTGVSIQATTYFKIHDQWVQLRFAGNDPQALSLKLQFVIGLRAGVAAGIQLEVEGQAMLEVEVRPTEVATLVADVTTILRNGLGTSTPSSVKASSRVIAPVLKQVFDYLKRADERGAELGAISILLAADSGVGVGIWDTGINFASVGSQITLSIPLETVVAAGADALATTLDAGLHSSGQLVSLFQAMAEGRLDGMELARQRDQIERTARDLGAGLKDAFASRVGDITLTHEMGIYALGDIGQVANQTVPVLVTTVEIPLGQMLVDGVEGSPKFARSISDTAQAMAWLAESAISAGLKGATPLSLGRTVPAPANPGAQPQRPRGVPPVPPTVAEWKSMVAEPLDDFAFTLQFGSLQVEGASLGTLVRLAGGAAEVTESLLRGAILSAVTANEKPMLDALRAAPGQIRAEAREQLISNLQGLSIGFVPSLGASGTVGAEVSAGFGGSIAFEARFKASLVLLSMDDPNYNDPHGTLLAGFDVPVEFSASAGVSLGEGVEFTAEGGYTAGMSLARLTLKDWGDDLPGPASLTVAGFEVIDFIGTNRQDGTISGTGWIVLPMGGLVRADFFTVDPSGKVTEGVWRGVVELGPMGERTIAGGKITNRGLTGVGDLVVGKSVLTATFEIRSNGLLFGSAVGNLDIGGMTLLNVAVSLTPDGSFAGSARTRIGSAYSDTSVRLTVQGSPGARLTSESAIGEVSASFDLQLGANGAAGTAGVDIFNQPVAFNVSIGPGGAVSGSANAHLSTPWGIALDADFLLDDTGIRGSGQTTILGSRFESTNLRIGKNGLLTGTFGGSLNVDGQVLSAQSLEIAGDRLEGRTSLDIAGQRAVETILTVDRNGVFGRFASDLTLFGMGTSETWVHLGSKIELFGLMDVSFLGSLESQLRDQLLSGLSDAQSRLAAEEAKLAGHQADAARLNVELAALYTQIQREQQAARAGAETALDAAEAALRDANAQLDKAIAALASVSGNLSTQLANASGAVRAAATALSAAQGEVNRINGAIANLDRWYNGLKPVEKGFAYVGYQASRGTLLASLSAANGSLAAAQQSYNAANATLVAIQQQLSNAQALLSDKALKEQWVAAAEAKAFEARRKLDSIIATIADPTIDPRYLVVALARDAVNSLIAASQQLIDFTIGALGQVGGLFEYIHQHGPNALVKVNRVSYQTRLADLNDGFMQLTVDALVANEPRQFRMTYNLKTGRNQGYIATAATQLAAPLSPPTAWTVSPWTNDETSGITPGQTLWAYHFNSSGTVRVATVPVVGVPGLTPAVPRRFSVRGFASAYSGDQNALTAGNDGSARIASDFLWGQNPGIVTLDGLEPGRTYRATFLSVGWDEPPVARNVTFAGDSGRRLVSQNQYGNDQGIRIEHTFTAMGPNYVVFLTPEGFETFHLYAMALSLAGPPQANYADWKQSAFGPNSFNPSISGDDADPDNDGIPNLVEYALRSDPGGANASGFRPPELVSPPGSVPTLQFTLPYRAEAADIVYHLRHSGDLRNWTEAFRFVPANGGKTGQPGVDGTADPANQTLTILVTNPNLTASPSLWSLTIEKR